MHHSWAVAMTVNEPAQLVLANVAWHLGTGASEVFIYLDEPDDPVAAELERMPRVHVVRCDRAHWRAAAPRRQRPDSINRRQGLNAEDAMVRCGADWLIHLDADEFLLQDRPLGAELAVVRELDCELHFPVFERCFRRDAPVRSLFSGAFRSTTKGLNRRGDGFDTDTAIFGAQAPVLHHGVLAHSAGKCAAPTNADFRPGLHWAYRGKGNTRAERFRSTSTRLLHFDGMTRLHWLAKLIRYRDTEPKVLKLPPHRRAQIEIFQEIADDPGALAEFHRELRELDGDTADRLRAVGLLHELAFDPAPVLDNVLAAVPDLSPGAFDGALRARQPDLPALA